MFRGICSQVVAVHVSFSVLALHWLYITYLSCTNSVKQFLDWLKDCAVYATQSMSSQDIHYDPGVIRPSRQHIQCVAAILWKSTENFSFNVSSLLSEELFMLVYHHTISRFKTISTTAIYNSIWFLYCIVTIAHWWYTYTYQYWYILLCIGICTTLYAVVCRVNVSSCTLIQVYIQLVIETVQG